MIAALNDPAVIKAAYNAQFERVCLSRHLGRWLDPHQWRCTAVMAAYLTLPSRLADVAVALKLSQQKMEEGKDLIRYFCTPAKAKDGSTFRHYPSDAPEKWETFKAYNLRDVETEMAIQDKLSKFPVAESEWHNYHLDQQINDRGIMLDRTMVRQAIRCDEEFKRTHMEQARNVTGLENPNSPVQLKAWLAEKGVDANSLSKAAVLQMLESAEGEVELALSLRQELAKSSVKKYTAMESVVGSDSRARGLIQFYGANRTGRYAGRLIQVQNLPQNHLPDLEAVRSLIRDGQFEAVEMLYDSVPMVLSELIRTAFIPKPGHRFFVADFAAIEARVIAWLAGEQWRQEVFASGGDIYCASASQMFHVPVEKHGQNSHLRQKGKIAELALGYGGSVGALKAMGALNYGLQESELKPLVDAWRQSNPRIVRFWWDVDSAAKTCVKERQSTETHGIKFRYQSGMLFIVLPSGRKLVYVRPRIGENKFGGESITYEGVGEQKKWLRLESYGPKFVENIVQATARDILAEAMLRLDAHGYKIVMHVHDEAVIEAPEDVSLEDICTIMGQAPTWANGLLLRADGYVCGFAPHCQDQKGRYPDHEGRRPEMARGNTSRPDPCARNPYHSYRREVFGGVQVLSLLGQGLEALPLDPSPPCIRDQRVPPPPLQACPHASEGRELSQELSFLATALFSVRPKLDNAGFMWYNKTDYRSCAECAKRSEK